MLKPIILYSQGIGPNPWKVAIILEELSIPYQNQFVSVSDLKKSPFVDVNPNGRLPAIEDPNTGINLWESGAIVEYLVETYDKEGKISFESLPEKYHAKQWLAYQISGQGPYFGQAAWFTHFHHEKVASAQARYLNEIKRVTNVLDLTLAKEEWLVGGKCSYADLSFIMWYLLVDFIDVNKECQFETKCPNYTRWMNAMMERSTVKKILEERKDAIAAGH